MFRLIDVVPELICKKPSNLVVTETICKAIIKAAVVGNNSSIVLESDGLGIVSSLIDVLSKLKWQTLPVCFLRLACESITRLITLFQPQYHYALLQLVSSILNEAIDDFVYKSSVTSSIAIGGSFPSDLPDAMYRLFIELGIHDRLRSLVALYAEMNEIDLSNILSVLCRFIKAKPSCASDYISDSIHLLLLFAAQDFSDSEKVQNNLWKFLQSLLINCREFDLDLNPQVLIPAILPSLKETTCCLVPLVKFIIEYIRTAKSSSPFVLVCFTEHPEFIECLCLRLLDLTKSEVQSEKKLNEAAFITKLLEFFFERFKSHSTVKYILKYGIIDYLKKSAVKWPVNCCISFCVAIRKFIDHMIVDVHPALRQFLHQVPDTHVQEKELFYKENWFLPFVELLGNPDTFSSQEIRVAIYDTIKYLLRSAPSNAIAEWLTDEFLMSFISNLPMDMRKHQRKVHLFIFTGHFIVYNLKAERFNVIRDQKWHEVAINECFKYANYQEARTTSFGFSTCILQGYNQFFKDISCFYDSEFPETIMEFAEEYGLGLKSEAGDSFGSLILTLTADKKASIVLHKNGFLESLYPFVDDQYDPQVIRPAIHAVGNIALAGHHVKQEILDKDFHTVLIYYLNSKMSTAEPSVLSACCRVLHILASGDWAKRNFAEKGLVDILMKMLDSRRDNAEICWRPLGLLSSLGFMALSSREYVITEKVLKTVVNVLKNTQHSKVKSYTALVFLASIDSDRRSTDLQRLKVTEIFQQVLQQSETSDDSYDDLHKWGSSLLEKGHLFTIPLKRTHLRPEQEQLLASCMVQSITWPEKASTLSSTPEVMDKSQTVLPLLDQSRLAPRFPEAPELTDDAKSQILQLGLNPNSLLRIGRFFGNSHGSCSNCDKTGRSEELVFRPQSLMPSHYQELIMKGWYRRGGVKLFRYRYNHNLDCSDWETRVIIAEFDHRKHKSYKKVLRKMPEDRLTVETVPTQFIPEAYDLYNVYHLHKHDKPMKSEFSYCEHVVNSPFCNQSIDGFQCGTFHQLYRLDGKLVAVGVIDIVPNGVVSIYMWYDMAKEITKLSFGVYSALKEIEFARELSRCNPNIKYYYMQGWNGNNHKLSYKARYEPEEFYSPCTVTDWVFSLEGVKKEQDTCKEKWQALNKQPSLDNNDPADPPSSSNTNSITSSSSDIAAITSSDVPGHAISLDRITYKAETDNNEPNVMNTVVCLNHQLYMYLGEMLDTYSVEIAQRELMIKRVEELILAVGHKLTRNLVIDMMACPTTGDIKDYVPFGDLD